MRPVESRDFVVYPDSKRSRLLAKAETKAAEAGQLCTHCYMYAIGFIDLIYDALLFRLNTLLVYG